MFRTEKKFLAAAAEGDIDTLRDYLSKAPSWIKTAEKKSGDTALLLATRNNKKEAVSFLLEKGAHITDYSRKTYATPLHEATMNGHTELVKFLLDKGAADQITGGSYVFSALQLAIREDKPEILQMFIKTGKANLAAGSPPAVYYAVQQRKPEMLRLLLEAGASANVPKIETSEDYWGRNETTKSSPLSLAVTINDTAMGIMLLDAGAKAEPAEVPLLAAAGHGNITMATELIKRGASLRSRNGQEQTALHIAAMKNQLEMARFLLAQGVSRDMADKQGNTPLAYAQQFAMKEMIELLQNPLPPPVEIKPIEIKSVPAAVAVAPVVVEKPKPVVTAPVAAKPAPQVDTETWQLAGKNSVIHTNTYPSLNRKLTEIFNFESRERVVITENLALKTESMGPHMPFDTLTEEYLRRALQEFRKQGGKADDNYVFRGQLNKPPLKAP